MYAINHKCSSFVVDWLSLFMPVYFFLLKYNRFPAHSAFSAAFFAVFLAGFFSSSPSAAFLVVFLAAGFYSSSPSAAFFAVFLAGFFSSSPSVFSALEGFSALALSTTTAMAFSFRS